MRDWAGGDAVFSRSQTTYYGALMAGAVAPEARDTTGHCADGADRLWEDLLKADVEVRI